MYGGSAIAGLVRRHELEASDIPHALAIAMRPDALNRLASGGEAWVWPASSADGGNGGGYSTSGNLYMGSLLAIPPSVDIDALGLSAHGLAVATALQDYGAYIVDSGGGNLIFYAESSASGVVQSKLGKDLDRITQYREVVDNNSPNSVGGGGVRRRDPGPDLSAEPRDTVSVFGMATLGPVNGHTFNTTGALVGLYNGKGELVALQPTDTNGRYMFQDLDPDEYTIKINSGGYQTFFGVTDLDEEQFIELLPASYMLAVWR